MLYLFNSLCVLDLWGWGAGGGGGAGVDTVADVANDNVITI